MQRWRVNPEATHSYTTEPNCSGAAAFKFLRSYGADVAQFAWNGSADDMRIPSMKQMIERLEAQLLACGQSLELCESGKAFMRSELHRLEDEIAAISLNLTRVRGESRGKCRIDDFSQDRPGADCKFVEGCCRRTPLTTNSLRAEVKQLREEVRILRGAAPPATKDRGSPEQEETKRAESKVDDRDVDNRFVGSP